MTHEGGKVSMKVQLIVVQGKPEGKVIPLVGPVFKIGRGETCHLRPNSERVSREHAEFTVTGDKVVVRDLGSRNGTLVNGKALNQPCTLKDRDDRYSAATLAAGSTASTRAAQYLNSGILPNGSSAGLVSRLAAASTNANGMNTTPSGMASS